jgi:hypothetical protein
MNRAPAYLVSTAAAALLGASACGPSRPGAYPSYEATVAQYAPPGDYVPAAEDGHDGHFHGVACGCQRVWYHDRWVYDYHDRWEYWDGGWWWYPAFFEYGPPPGAPVHGIRRDHPGPEHPHAHGASIRREKKH